MKEEALDRTMWRNRLEEALDLSSDRILNNNKCVTAVTLSNFSRHYLRNRSTSDIGVLGYIGVL